MLNSWAVRRKLFCYNNKNGQCPSISKPLDGNTTNVQVKKSQNMRYAERLRTGLKLRLSTTCVFNYTIICVFYLFGNVNYDILT